MNDSRPFVVHIGSDVHAHLYAIMRFLLLFKFETFK